MPPAQAENLFPDEAVGAGSFRTTHWSHVLLAGQENSPNAQRALEELCQAYWYPLYAYARRKGRGNEDAQDVVQGFFERLLSRHDLAAVHPSKGLFRTFLLTSLSHFMANEWDRAQAVKRGGRVEFVPLDATDPQERYRHEPPDHETPETFFERMWAEQMLERVLGLLRNECGTGERLERFERLKGFLLGEREGAAYAELSRTLGMSEQGIKSAVHRLRQRFRELFREEIARTVSRPEEIDDELRHLARVMAG